MNETQIIIPNLNPRFSGITSTILAVVPEQQKSMNFISVGYKLSEQIPHCSWLDFFRLTSKPLENGAYRIFHCRRNIDMCYGLILKYIFRRKIQLLFTSTAQRFHKRFTRFLYNNVDHLITTSNRAGSFLKRPVEAVIPHGVNVEIYYPTLEKAKERTELNLTNKYSIGIFGRVRESKGLNEFVEALCQVLPKFPEYNAVIVGETTPKFIPFEKKLKEMIDKNNLNNRFQWLGKVSFSNIPKLFRAMDLVCAVSRNEGFGLTCLEAMASGVPVIATQTGGFEMVIQKGLDGEIIPCQDTEALVQKLEMLLKNPEKLLEMGLVARENICKNFTISKEANKINDFYKKILTKE